MTPTQNLLARTAVSALFSLATVVVTRIRKLFELPRQTFDRLVMGGFLVSRWGLWLAVFVVAHIAPHGDVTIYVEEATEVLKGKLPYRDFLSSYAPLHCFLDAGLLRLWHDSRVILLFALFFECFLLPVWLRAAREFFSEAEVRMGALLYLTSALSVQFVTVDGQDNVVVALLFAISMLMILRNRFVASGFALGTAISVFKFLPLLYLPAYVRALKKPWQWILGGVVPIAAVYGWALSRHLQILAPLSRESYKTANCLAYVVEALIGVELPDKVWNALLGAGLLLVLGIVISAMQNAPQAARLRILTLGMAAVTLVILSLPKKSWPPYFLLALFPVCMLVAPLSRAKIALFAAFQVLAVSIPSVWADVFVLADALPMHALLLAHQPSAVLFYLGQVLLIAGYFTLLWTVLRQIQAGGAYRVAPAAAASVTATAA